MALWSWGVGHFVGASSGGGSAMALATDQLGGGCLTRSAPRDRVVPLVGRWVGPSTGLGRGWALVTCPWGWVGGHLAGPAVGGVRVPWSALRSGLLADGGCTPGVALWSWVWRALCGGIIGGWVGHGVGGCLAWSAPMGRVVPLVECWVGPSTGLGCGWAPPSYPWGGVGSKLFF